MCAASSSWHSSLDSQPHRLYRRVGSLHPSSASSDPPCAGKLRFRLDNPGCTAVHVAGSSVAAASQALSLVVARVQFHPLFVRERSLGGWRRATPPPNRARSPSHSLFELENNPVANSRVDLAYVWALALALAELGVRGVDREPGQQAHCDKRNSNHLPQFRHLRLPLAFQGGSSAERHQTSKTISCQERPLKDG